MGSLLSRLRGRLNPGSTESHAERPETPGQRRASVAKWWTYYNGADPITGLSQWHYLYRRFETMPRRELEDFENHTRICADRLKRLLVNSWRGFEFDREAEGAAIRQVLESNHWAHLLHLAVLSGTVTGDAFIKLAPAPATSPSGPVRLILLDTGSVELIVSPHDRDDIRRVIVTYDFFEQDAGHGNRPQKRTYREIIDETSVTGYVDDEYAPGYSYDHNLGLIPVVHIRHRDTGGGIYGESLVARLVEAQDALNMITSDMMDIVRYDGHKTTIFQNVTIDKGASRDGQTSGEVDLSIGKGLVVKGEGRVYKLDQQHDLGAAIQEYDRKVEMFYDLAGAPRISRDLAPHLGSLSGRAIERLYQDAIESTREAQVLYGESFAELAQKISRMLGSGDIRAEVLWNSDVITPDIDALRQELEIGIRSRRSVMRKLGIADAERMIAEIAAEKG